MKLIKCHACGAKFDVSTFPAGKKFRCGKCKEVLTVPDLEIPELDLPPEPEPEPEPEPAGVDVQTEPEPEPEPEPAPAPAARAKKPIGAKPIGAKRPAAKTGASTGIDLAPAQKSPFRMIAIAAVVVLALGGGGFFAWKKFGGGGGTDAPGADDVYKRKLAKLEKSSGIDNLRLALWCKANGHEKYEQHVTEAGKLAPGDAQVKCGLADLYWARLAKKEPASAQECLALRAQAEAAGLEGEKKRLTRLAIRFEPSNEDAWKALGCIKYAPEGGTEEWLPKSEAEKRTAEDAALKVEKEKYSALSVREKAVLEVQAGLANEFGSDFIVKEAKPFLLCLQKSDTYNADLRLEEFEAEMRLFYSRFYDRYGAKFELGDLSEQVLLIWIWRDHEAYKTYGAKIGLPPGAGGHFEPFPGQERLMLFNNMDDPYGTIFHEGTHMLIHFATRLRGKTTGQMLWFTEGIATYFEPFERTKEGKIEQKIGSMNSGRFPMIKQALGVNRHVGLKEMLSKTYPEFSREMSDSSVPADRRLRRGLLYYAQAWSLVYFFHNHENGKYLAKFESYFREELNGNGGFQSFSKIFGEDLQTLEREWVEFTKSLR